MNQNGKWNLSPAYDVCHAYRPGSDWVSQHCLSVNGKRKDINRKDLVKIGKQMNIKKADKIIDQISSVISNWSQYAAKVDVNQKLTSSIKKTLLVL
jgi:serine/threonine-protein kinase HipA